MKLRTRLFIAFLTVILLPICLTLLMFFAFSRYQMGAIEKTYGIENTTVETLSNSMQVLSRLTERSYHNLEAAIEKNPDDLEDATYLEDFNDNLEKKNSYLLVRKGYRPSEQEQREYTYLYRDRPGKGRSSDLSASRIPGCGYKLGKWDLSWGRGSFTGETD